MLDLKINHFFNSTITSYMEKILKDYFPHHAADDDFQYLIEKILI